MRIIEEPKNEKIRERTISWVLLTVNVLVPVLETAFEVIFYRDYFLNGNQPSNALTQILNSFSMMVAII